MDLQDRDVVNLDRKRNIATGPTSQIGEIKKAIQLRFPGYEFWISDDGFECELLREGGKWQVGRIRLKLEFIPDEPDSPLDELRSDLDI
ncbi:MULTISPECIES: KGK domain-containing protein [unclassified Nodularia (in: cyanobacteria)]|uniref:KGK domain-containing protein n=1 Tax=unclassified Nodularia (in: cyanobacteria) TaxID=2656917 RepID=UPI0018824930|nr:MULTISPECIES: KGK domain-containing protein [unclassified Nodularia (in: cyanobacteria)]MBE9199079.1 hypothetical protein [Nodularia sp. LEGE 06071]MCC2694081.1 hypothetical protein [Nodularia sp. LEGE 04288]